MESETVTAIIVTVAGCIIAISIFTRIRLRAKKGNYKDYFIENLLSALSGALVGSGIVAILFH